MTTESVVFVTPNNADRDVNMIDFGVHVMHIDVGHQRPMVSAVQIVDSAISLLV